MTPEREPVDLPAVIEGAKGAWKEIEASNLGDRMKRALQRVAGGQGVRESAEAEHYSDSRDLYRYCKRFGLIDARTKAIIDTHRHVARARGPAGYGTREDKHPRAGRDRRGGDRQSARFREGQYRRRLILFISTREDGRAVRRVRSQARAHGIHRPHRASRYRISRDDRRNSEGESMTHHELSQLTGEPLGLESEEQRQFRRERAERLWGLAQQHGGAKSLAGITLEQLSVMAPAFAVMRLGLPSSVLLDELRRPVAAPSICALSDLAWPLKPANRAAVPGSVTRRPGSRRSFRLAAPSARPQRSGPSGSCARVGSGPSRLDRRSVVEHCPVAGWPHSGNRTECSSTDPPSVDGDHLPIFGLQANPSMNLGLNFLPPSALGLATPRLTRGDAILSYTESRASLAAARPPLARLWCGL